MSSTLAGLQLQSDMLSYTDYDLTLSATPCINEILEVESAYRKKHRGRVPKQHQLEVQISGGSLFNIAFCGRSRAYIIHLA